MKIKDFKKNHPKIYLHIRKTCIELGKEFNEEWRIDEHFFWSASIDGIHFWSLIDKGDYTKFYSKYSSTYETNSELLKVTHPQFTVGCMVRVNDGGHNYPNWYSVFNELKFGNPNETRGSNKFTLTGKNGVIKGVYIINNGSTNDKNRIFVHVQVDKKDFLIESKGLYPISVPTPPKVEKLETGKWYYGTLGTTHRQTHLIYVKGWLGNESTNDYTYDVLILDSEDGEVVDVSSISFNYFESYEKIGPDDIRERLFSIAKERFPEGCKIRNRYGDVIFESNHKFSGNPNNIYMDTKLFNKYRTNVTKEIFSIQFGWATKLDLDEKPTPTEIIGGSQFYADSDLIVQHDGARNLYVNNSCGEITLPNSNNTIILKNSPLNSCQIENNSLNLKRKTKRKVMVFTPNPKSV